MTTHTTEVQRMTSAARQELRTAVDQARRAALVAEKGQRYVGYDGPHGRRGYEAGCRCPICKRGGPARRKR